MAHIFFDRPTESMAIVGVTGTNGKTTVVTLLSELLQRAGCKTGLISTVENKINGLPIPKEDEAGTTPHSIALHRAFKAMKDAGCTHACMEVSSIAVDQNRISGVEFRGGIFTNLTHDHLDYHHTFEAYRVAKQTFFTHLKPSSFALTNTDSPEGEIMIQNTHGGVYRYGLTNPSVDFWGTIESSDMSGQKIRLVDGSLIESRLVGTYNASNILAVYGAARLLEIPQEQCLSIFPTLSAPEGRMDTIHGPKNIVGIIDYAHTPDALIQILTTLRTIHTSQIITVVGAGGDRDPSKRSAIGIAAVTHSDYVIFTSDNPRYEDPNSILNMISSDIPDSYKESFETIIDRREAIKKAITKADENTLILLAGKGHETYQDIQGIKHPYSDREELLQALKERDTS